MTFLVKITDNQDSLQSLHAALKTEATKWWQWHFQSSLDIVSRDVYYTLALKYACTDSNWSVTWDSVGRCWKHTGTLCFLSKPGRTVGSGMLRLSVSQMHLQVIPLTPPQTSLFAMCEADHQPNVNPNSTSPNLLSEVQWSKLSSCGKSDSRAVTWIAGVVI